MKKLKNIILAVCTFLVNSISRVYAFHNMPYIGYAPVDIVHPIEIIAKIFKIGVFPIFIFFEGLIIFSKKKTKKQKIKETLFIWSLFIVASCVIQYLMHQETMVVAD